MQSDGGGGAERLGVFVVPDISTYYRDRERTLPTLATLIEGVCSASGGNYLVAFPSFEYVALAAEACAGPNVRCQRPDMDLAEREEFIDWLGECAGRTAFVVLGGVFTESVDFDGRTLHGIIVVGPGLPPRTLRRDLIATDSVADGVADDGDELAYRQPAMTRVVQAVGRIARAPTERGVAVLVDPRFRQGAYSAFLPQRWAPQTVRAREAAHRVRAFWRAPA
jgi:Rad3-related DNA helicase